MTTVSVLGTGTMGLPMASNLKDAGFAVRAWNRSPARAQPLADDGAELFDDPAEAVEGGDGGGTMLSNADAVLETASAALESIRSDATWIQMSTIGIAGTERCL